MHTDSHVLEHGEEEKPMFKLDDVTDKTSQMEQKEFHSDFVSDKDFVWTCSICHIRFMRARDIRAHRRLKHKGVDTLFEDKTLIIRREKRVKKPGICEIC